MKAFAIVVMLVALAIIGYFFIYKPMPEYSLKQVKQAAQQHDQEKFAKYVDIDSIGVSLANQFVAYVSKEKNDSLVNASLAKAAGNVKHQLDETFKLVVVDFVKHGKYPAEKTLEGYDDEVSPSAMLMRLQDAIVEKLEFKGFKTIDKKDGHALVTANFYMPQKNTNLQLELRLKDQGRHWQIVEIRNLDNFLKDL